MLPRLTGVFRSFQDHDVRYLVIGGVAVMLHGVPRSTFDVDILIDPTRENAERLLRALVEAGLASAEDTNARDVAETEITTFNDRIRMDVMTKIPGTDFETCWPRRATLKFRDQEFFVISKQDLIVAKRASGSSQDLEDVRALELRP